MPQLFLSAILSVIFTAVLFVARIATRNRRPRQPRRRGMVFIRR